MRFAVLGRVPSNPAEEIKVPRGSRRLREAHELAEIRLIAGAQKRIGDEAAVLVMGRLGLRKMEAARLQARDINLGEDVLYIRDAKGGKPAELPITFPELRQALSLWLSEPGRKDDDYLIAPQRGPNRALDPASIHRWWERCCGRAGVGPSRRTSSAIAPCIASTARPATSTRPSSLPAMPRCERPRRTYIRRPTTSVRGCSNRTRGESVHKPPRSQAVRPCECTITGVMSSSDSSSQPAAPPRPAALDQKNSPSRFPFRPPFSMTFPLRVVPSNSASTYSGSVLGARGNLGAGHGLFKVLRRDRNRNLRKFNYPHIHSRLCSLWITPTPLRRGKVRPCRTSDSLRCHTGSCPSSGASHSASTSGWVGSR